MSKINYNEVPGCYLHCIKADCKMANQCLRQLAMQAADDSVRSFAIINPKLIEQQDKCEYYRDNKPQVYGKGFKNMQKKMLPDEYQTFMYRLQGKFGRTGYFERRRGERLCSPREIQTVKDVLKEIGLEHLKFDAYEEHYCWDD